MPVKPNRTDLQNYVPPGRPGGGEYASGTAEKGAIPKEQMKTTTITQELKDKAAIVKEKIKPNTKIDNVERKRLENTNDKLDYIKKNNNVIIKLDGIGKSEAEEIINSVYDHYEEFPEVSKSLTFIGGIADFTKTYLDKLTNSVLKNHYSKLGIDIDVSTLYEPMVAKVKKEMKKFLSLGSDSDTIALARRTPDNSISAIVINENYIKSKDMKLSLENGVKYGFHPVGTGSVKAIIDHEFGHKLDDIYKISSQEPIIKLYQEAKTQSESNIQNVIRKKYIQGNILSQYGFTNIKEFVAEAWAEYKNNPNPRQIAVIVGEAFKNAREKK